MGLKLNCARIPASSSLTLFGKGCTIRATTVNTLLGGQIRILIADEHRMLRDGLHKLLEAEPDFVVVGEASNGHETLERAQKCKPDMLLLGQGVPGIPYLEVLRTLEASDLPTRSLLLAASIEPKEIVTVLQLGARGIVMKDSASDLLMKAIRIVMTGQYWIGRESVSTLVDIVRGQSGDRTERPFGLTARELGIVTAVTAGFTNKEVAQRFSISEETVKHHLTRIYSKLGVSNRLELALFAISRKLVAPLADVKARSGSLV
jgi:two-component system, NarL family, nitrate/nitrite response regulator NarL